MNKNKNKVTIMPLGGVGEFGKNTTILEIKNEILVIDCGIKLAKKNFLGIEAEIADYKYLINNREKVAAILITHGHLDHIGGITYLIEKVKVPIYAPTFACFLIRDLLTEKNIRDVVIQEIREDEKIHFKHFVVDPIEVDHSIVDSYAYAIETPCGVIIHSGDYRDDPRPYKKNKTNIKKLKQYGHRGVLALLSDSTNVVREGDNVSESLVYKNLEKIIKNNRKGRIIFSTFSTQINRIQQILDIAIRLDYKVFLNGMYMQKNVKNAIKGYYQSNYDSVLEPISNISQYTPERVILVCTGSQGEERASLRKIALGEHRDIKLSSDDLIVFSSSVIPGNVDDVADLIDAFVRAGNRVITSKDIDIHSSGHGNKPDLLNLLKIVRPLFFCPVHGRYHHLAQHKKLAIEVGVEENNIFLLENGQRLDVFSDAAKMSTKVKLQPVYLEGRMISTADEATLQQRKVMMTGGVIFITLVLKDAIFVKVSCICQGVVGERHQEQTAKWISEQITLYLERSEIALDNRKLKKVFKKMTLKLMRDVFNKSPEVVVQMIDI